MSRSHMLYDDKKLNAVINVKWKGKWQEESVFNFAKNPGFSIEGVALGKSRLAVCDESGSGAVYRHYTVLQLNFKKAFKRTFSSTGEEIEPWKASTKKVNTGYLMSSYKTVATETSAINFQDIVKHVEVPALKLHIPERLKPLNSLLLFYNEASLPGVEVNIGDELRIKTRGCGPYIECLAKIDRGHVSSTNYESGASGQSSWTDKILSMKSNEDKGEDKQDGVDESEWDD